MFSEFFVLFTIIRLQEKRKESGRNGKTSSCPPRLGSKPRCSNLSSFLERTVLPCKSGDPKLNKRAYKVHASRNTKFHREKAFSI